MTHQAADYDIDRFAVLRERMVEEQLRRRGIHDPRVIQAMLEIPRHEFVDASHRDLAYCDMPLSIGFGQTISQPFTVAFMCQEAQIKPEDKVLEVGTGSGYGACVLGKLAREVHTVERIPELAKQAERRIRKLGFSNVHVHLANGSLGYAAEAPYDAIIVTASAAKLPEPYADQLASGGRIIIPIGSHYDQSLYRFTRRNGKELFVEDLGGFLFVPLIGEKGWQERTDESQLRPGR
ncbi:MAG: hypothetical protein KatS3mg105_1914 [Gemmatales bacterium]|nr:MAG: hypothetical protein KatS3mg105_1914 [Gemmatales bacterium]